MVLDFLLLIHCLVNNLKNCIKQVSKSQPSKHTFFLFECMMIPKYWYVVGPVHLSIFQNYTSKEMPITGGDYYEEPPFH